MKLKLLVTAMISAGLVAGAWAKGPAPKNDFRSYRAEVANAKAEVTPSAVSASDVGDADSFGRTVKFLGVMGSGQLQLSDDCTVDPNFPPGADDHCIVLNPQPAVTNFSVPDMGRMVIPGKSAFSLLCHMQTPVAVTSLHNNTAVNIQSARIVITPTYTFENSVLNNPALIDPTTGLPFNGKLTQSLAGIRHQMSLAPGQQSLERDQETRTCIGGMISKQALISSFGLTDAQATDFFKHDTIITVGMTGVAQGVEFASAIYGTRWLGD